jgi:hypothetical protein
MPAVDSPGNPGLNFAQHSALFRASSAPARVIGLDDLPTTPISIRPGSACRASSIASRAASPRRGQVQSVKALTAGTYSGIYSDTE